MLGLDQARPALERNAKLVGMKVTIVGVDSANDVTAQLGHGRRSTEGQWVWKWKDWIDRRFIERFSATPATKSMPLLKDSR